MPTMPTPREPDLEISRVAGRVLGRLENRAPREADLARRTLDRLGPDRWVLEWRLPRWLGTAFELDPGLADELVVSNVLGLISVRLEDDLRDGDVPPPDREAARRLAPAALDEALAVYRTRLPPPSPFWPFLDAAMDAWRGAQGPLAVEDRDATFSLGRLADRAAPLRVPAFAICLFTGREDRWPELERCLRRAAEALVGYDQVVDWQDDLGSGRWNAFVAWLSPAAQDAVHRERNRSTVLAAFLTRGVAAAAYGQVEASARAAAAIASDLGVSPLQAFLEDYAARTAEQGAAAQAHYERAADRALELVFGRSRNV
jgi:hypothetical protein